MTHVLGLDLGTSAVKALLLPINGQGPIRSHSVPLALSTPRPGWSEQDPDDWWQATTQAIGDLLGNSEANAAQIEAVGISGQMHGATLLDDRGQILRPSMLWNDQRSGGECDWITERVGIENLLKWVGNPALAGFTIPKVLWVRNNEPAVYAHVRHVLLPKDYLNFRLTGQFCTDYSDASGTLLFDVAHRRWSEDLAQALDVPVSWFPTAVDSTTIVGRVSSQAATATGLREGTPVVAGGADNACAAVGTGVVRPGQVLASIGTSGTLVAPMDQPRIDRAGRLHTFCHAVPHTWYAMGVVLSAGGSLQWWREILFPPTAEDDDDERYADMLERAGRVPPGSDGLIFLPYLSGERTPHGDPNARGVFFGLSLRHGRDHLTRSVIEGVSYALADSAELMREVGVSLETVRVTGGGAQSPLWRSILATVLGSRVLAALTGAGPAFGAAILAGVGAGGWTSVAEAANALVSITGETLPDPGLEQIYSRYHGLYNDLYPSLAGRFARLTRLVEENGPS